MKPANRTVPPAAAAAAALALVLALGACAGRYGSIRWDNEVEQVFAAAQVLPGHRYFTSGSDIAPDAILALRDDRPLRSNLWREVAMTPGELARLVGSMRGTRDDGPYGSVVLDEHGTRIGLWCSFQRPQSVKLLEDGGVIVSPPLGETRETPWFRGRGVD